MHITVPFYIKESNIYGFLVSFRDLGGNGTCKLGEGYVLLGRIPNYFQVSSSSSSAFSHILKCWVASCESTVHSLNCMHITNSITIANMPRE